MERKELTEGQAVWMLVGSYGWSAAIVVKINRVWVNLHTPERKQLRNAKSKPEWLRPRNPALSGEDKPSVKEAYSLAWPKGIQTLQPTA